MNVWSKKELKDLFWNIENVESRARDIISDLNGKQYEQLRVCGGHSVAIEKKRNNERWIKTILIYLVMWN